ncbi:hypothetical protein D3C85_978800 [compost metagenome]
MTYQEKIMRNVLFILHEQLKFTLKRGCGYSNLLLTLRHGHSRRVSYIDAILLVSGSSMRVHSIVRLT